MEMRKEGCSFKQNRNYTINTHFTELIFHLKCQKKAINQNGTAFPRYLVFDSHDIESSHLIGLLYYTSSQVINTTLQLLNEIIWLWSWGRPVDSFDMKSTVYGSLYVTKINHTEKMACVCNENI